MSTVSHCEHTILKLIKLIEALSPHSLTDNFLRKPPTKNAQHQGEGEEKKENLLDYHFGQNKDIFL